ncbi:MAG: glucosamine-6-phosphate deaminase [Clostridia bacterium]|nr:glucosamine-6-phosphate deaminase [Clostridia bacterium]
MRINVFAKTEDMGKDAAAFIAGKLQGAIAAQGEARLLLSTGASQLDMFAYLVQLPVDWKKVTMFHLDEYVGLPESHIASFRKYLKERFVDKVGGVKEAIFVNGEGNIEENIAYITRRLREKPIDVGVIGIGENGHIAFNDPPADFNTQESYIVVNLDDRCKAQQVGEGWFATTDDVPKQAISMSVPQIMQSKCIVSIVPHTVKAEAIENTFRQPCTNQVPATILKTHPDWNLWLDGDSAARIMTL